MDDFLSVTSANGSKAVFSLRLKSSKIFFCFYYHSQELTFVLCDTNYLHLRTTEKQIENSKLQHPQINRKADLQNLKLLRGSEAFIWVFKLQQGTRCLLSEFTNFITIFFQSSLYSRHIYLTQRRIRCEHSNKI